jgi:hypothetical protein
MKFKVEIKNFGKIEQATIQINNLTVLAGKNNVGKSFVSRALYAFFHAMNAEDHLYKALTEEFNHHLGIGLIILEDSIPHPSKRDNDFVTDARNILSNLREKLLSAQEASLLEKIELSGSILTDSLDQLSQRLAVYKERLGNGKKFVRLEPHLRSIAEEIIELKHHVIHSEFILKRLTQNLHEAFKNELKQNFQVRKLRYLKRNQSKAFSSFEIESIGKVSIEDETISFSIVSSSLDTIQKLSQVIYIESPLYWKLKSALERNRLSVSHAFRIRGKASQYLTGIPNYFYDLSNLLRLQSIEEPQFKEILRNIEREIGGRLRLSDEGNLVFQTEKAGTHPISITALGVANLGMIAMLLEKNLIDAGTFLFIDEPEAHLHPAWQVTLMKSLYQLAKQDVNIVITTHSVDMLKCLEILIKEEPDAKALIALNHLGVEGRALNEDVEFEEKLGLMKQDLLEPFYNLYLEGL